MKLITTQFKHMVEAFIEKDIDLKLAVILTEEQAVKLFNEANGYLSNAPMFMISREEKVKQVNGGQCYGVNIYVESK